MRAFVLVLVFGLAVFAHSQPAFAQDSAALLRDFDAGSLTRDDKRFLQAALAFEGDYNGLLDGDWGAISQRALDQYAQREYGTGAQDWHMAMLAFDFYERIQSEGWEVRSFQPLGLSFLYPANSVINDAPTGRFVNWRHSNSSLSYSVAVSDAQDTSAFHGFTLSSHEISTPAYSVRRAGLAVTRATARDGSVLYTRSNFISGQWSTVMLSAQARDAATLNAVAASISIGRADTLTYTIGGRLYQAVMNALEVAESGDEEQTARDTAAPAPEERGRSAGSGFFVSSQGHVLTNAHVIDGCTNVTVNGSPARIIDMSPDFDLAILQAPYDQEKSVAVFSSAPAELNSDVTVAGFPYAGVLGGLNITRGSVSSARGIGGGGTQMQITAPVQSGNSGGPVIGSSGEVVGVVVSKLDAVKVADALGDLPQNVNFAVRGEIAKLFLFQNGLEPILGNSQNALSPVELARQAARFTVFVECN